MNLNQRIAPQAAPPVSQIVPTVAVVDDDVSVRESLELLIESGGWQAKTFASAQEYLARPASIVPSCLVLDVGLPDINGLDLQQRITEELPLPIIFVTGRGDIPSSVRAIKAGAIDFLIKPINGPELLRAIGTAIALDHEFIARRSELAELRQRLASLTPREREVLPLIVSGLLNKQTAWELGISEVTVQVHRSKVMQKMKAGSFAELVRMAGTLGISATRNRHAHV